MLRRRLAPGAPSRLLRIALGRAVRSPLAPCSVLFVGGAIKTHSWRALCSGARAPPPADEVRAAAIMWQEAAQSAKGAPTPRFPLGAPVECRLGDDWVRGAVVKHFHRESSWPEHRCAVHVAERPLSTQRGSLSGVQ